MDRPAAASLILVLAMAMAPWTPRPAEAQRTPVAGDVCAVDNERNAYRYNNWIISSLDMARRDASVGSIDSRPAFARIREENQRRLTDLATLKEDGRRLGVYPAPLYLDLYSECSNPLHRRVEGERLLRRGDVSFRISGSPCDAEPILRFYGRAHESGFSGLTPRNFWLADKQFSYQNHLVGQFYLRSAGRFATALQSLGRDGRAPLSDLETNLMFFAAIAQRQCGSVPTETRLVGLLPDEPEAPRSRYAITPLTYRQVYTGLLRIDEAGLRVEHDDIAAAALHEQFATYLSAERGRAWHARQRQGEDFAFGVALVAIGLALASTIESPAPQIIRVPGQTRRYRLGR